MTEKLYLDLNPHARILLGPGPGMAAPRVIRAMATPPVGHLDPDLLAIYAEEQELLRYVFQTENEWTFALSGTGTSGMEAALTNLIEPGDDVLVAIIGYFGERLAEIATRQGANVDRVNKSLGEIFSVEEIEAALKQKKYKVFAFVHAETSTGAEQLHVKEIVDAAHKQGALVVMDTVTSLGSIPLKVDEWGVDIAYSASQKGLGAPSGLAPITVGPRAQEAIEKRATARFILLSRPEAICELLGRARLPSHRLCQSALCPARSLAHDLRGRAWITCMRACAGMPKCSGRDWKLSTLSPSSRLSTDSRP